MGAARIQAAETSDQNRMGENYRDRMPELQLAVDHLAVKDRVANIAGPPQPEVWKAVAVPICLFYYQAFHLMSFASVMPYRTEAGSLLQSVSRNSVKVQIFTSSQMCLLGLKDVKILAVPTSIAWQKRSQGM